MSSAADGGPNGFDEEFEAEAERSRADDIEARLADAFDESFWTGPLHPRHQTDGWQPSDPSPTQAVGHDVVATGDAQARPGPATVVDLGGIDEYLAKLLAYQLRVKASDLHLSCGIPPTVRVDGVLVAVPGQGVLEEEQVTRMLRSTLSDELWTVYQDYRQVDYSLELPGHGRFRVNSFHQRSSPAAAFRAIEHYIPSLEELGLPPGVQRMMYFPYGLVLFVGPTGSGKSTTQASLIDRLGASKPCHILTIEDPVEYLHRHQLAIVNQREVGSDVRSFAAGLKAAMREDPDVVLLGEMRDEESISTTLTLAETGHLVFATLHTNDAAQAIDRLIDSYPAERRDQIQTQISSVLQGVVSQRLPRRIGGGRVGAFEVLVANDAVRNLIREGKTRQIRNVIATSSHDGMQTLEASLDALVQRGVIAYEEALSFAQYPKEIRDPAVVAATAAAGLAQPVAAGRR